MKNLAASFFITLLSFSFLSAQNNNIIPGELIVMLQHKQSVDEVVKELNALHPGADFTISRDVSRRFNIWVLAFDMNFLPQESALLLVKRHERVAIAQHNHTVQERLVPNDPTFASNQWSMNNTGQTGGTADADVDAIEAWDITTGGLTAQGDTIVVAVVDGGFQMNHPDLQQNIYRNYGEIPGNGIDDDNNGYIDDVNGWNAYNNNGTIPNGFHGTHVAGIVGARGNNNTGVAGVNWNVKIMTIAGSSGNEATVVSAYAYAATMRELYNQTNGQQGAFVVSTNASFGVDYGNPINYPIWCAFYDTLGTLGVLNAGAGPNLGINIDNQGDIPTTCPSNYLVAVTNTNHNDQRNNGAGYGIVNMDIGAPGTNIYSCNNSSSYQNATGTSMATPHVAGAIGLYYAAACSQFITDYKANPGALALTMRNYLLTGVDSITSMTNDVSSRGRLNLFKGIQRVQSYVCLVNVPPVAGFNSSSASGCPGLTVNFTSTTQGNPDSVVWFFPGGSPSTSSSNSPVVTYNAYGQYNVQLIAYNAFGSDTVTLVNYVDVNNTSVTTIFSEDFEIPDFVTTGWSVVNPDNANTWYLAPVQGTLPGSTAAAVNIFNNQNNAGQVDGLISPVIDLSSNTNVELYFEHAHRRRVTNVRDSLWISASTDGGITWPHRLLRTAENGMGSFATGTLLTQNFVPSGTTSWCFDAQTNAVCFTIDLSAFDAEPFFRLKFEVQNNSGNNIYVDNVRIQGVCALPPPVTPVADFSGNMQQVCEGDQVTFTDLSQNSPTSWNWTFPGGTPASSTLQNPVVTYPAAGTYAVTLVAANSAGSHTVSLNNYIQVWPAPAPPVIAGNGNDLVSSYATGNQWNDGNGPIPGATEQQFTPSTSATYTVTYTDANGCSSTSAPYMYYLDAQSWEISGIHLYPNPLYDVLYISLSAPGECLVKVTDLSGKTVAENVFPAAAELIKTIDLSAVSAGVYLVEVFQGNQIYRGKIIRP